MRYELAILLPEDDVDAGAIFLLCLIILTIVSILLIPLLYVFGNIIAGILGSEEIVKYLFLVPLAVFIDGLYLALRYWNTRRKRFGTQAITQALQSISSSGLKLGTGVFGFINPGSIIISQIIGQFTGVIILGFQILRADFCLILNSFSFRKICQMLIRYRKFPLIDTISSFVNTLSAQLPVFLLTGFFTSTSAGLYTLGMQMLNVPASFIGSSISQVFFQRISFEKHSGSIGGTVADVLSILILLSVLPFLILGIIGGDIFGFLFGQEWYEAGVYVQILCFLTMVWFITTPLTIVFPALELQSQFLVFNSINIIVRFLSLLVGGLMGDVYSCLILYMITGIIVYATMGLYVIYKSQASIKQICYNVWKGLLLSVLLGFSLFLFWLLGVTPLLLCILSVVFIGIYGLVLIRTNSVVKEYLGL